ncbi:hypothetical protein AVEN_4937-1 [Araneus ventricosus]|uniref:RNase H type-1 domain-containing protein n=1 Tax=Araneus ventricosus TaxID=182803 RepID=A0A4Y2E4W0_ARAVE|nr:hypothetical protein AVEN_4937-1 [Araneus ventricosus]
MFHSTAFISFTLAEQKFEKSHEDFSLRDSHMFFSLLLYAKHLILEVRNSRSLETQSQTNFAQFWQKALVWSFGALVELERSSSLGSSILRQLALKIINDILVDAVTVYTDGSRNDSDCTGSGIYIKTHNHELKIQRRNPDFCSVFRSELISIDEGLDSLSSFSCSNEIWILTDSRSSIQHLTNWHRVRDNTGMNILNKLKSLSVSYRIHLQWIPSHVNIQGNEIAEALAKAGADDASVPSAPLTYLELFSRAKSGNKTIWLIPPVHHWYQGSRPGGCLSIDCSRRDQAILTPSLGAQAHGPDIALLIFGDQQQQQQKFDLRKLELAGKLKARELSRFRVRGVYCSEKKSWSEGGLHVTPVEVFRAGYRGARLVP